VLFIVMSVLVSSGCVSYDKQRGVAATGFQ
jgi:hypothetical protein